VSRRKRLVARAGTVPALSRGGCIAVALWLVLAGCGDRSAPAVSAPAAPVGFDGERAFRDLEALVRIGPRPAGSNGAEQARALIRERLRQAGWLVEAQTFRATPPGGGKPVAMVNLVAQRSHAASPVLLITHYDTKSFADQRFVGANDGASGVAALLELARATAGDQPPLPLQLAFVDGEEAFGPTINAEDGLFGSKVLAQRMADAGELAKLRALILVDMIGDRDLNLALDYSSSAELRDRFDAAATKLGVPPLIDTRQAMSVIDDHTPFQERGVREVLALIDFQYGARVSPGPRWHTSADDLEGVSADSLGSFGRVLVQMLRDLGAEPRGGS
jgi:Zn-dependent M28 family amino/carboxypeptidase